MNKVQIIGRLTRDAEVRYTQDGMAIAAFAVAIDRPPKKDGTKGADFPKVKAFGKQAENIEKYIGKGCRVAVDGRLQTGSYEKDGAKVFTTEVIAEHVEFIDFKQNNDRTPAQQNYDTPQSYAQQNFQNVTFEDVTDEDLPF